MRLNGVQAKQIKFISAAPLSQFYPREAMARRQLGKATLDLLIDASGVVVDVRVLSEDPLGMGFGDAAAASAKTYKFYNPLNHLVATSMPVKFSP
jgi:TonB family protein